MHGDTFYHVLSKPTCCIILINNIYLMKYINLIIILLILIQVFVEYETG